MFGNGFNNGSNSFQFGNSYTNPYGYGYQPQVPQPQQTPTQINTNKIYVSGIDEVRQRQLPNGSDMLFLDNDKPLLYQKVVDGKGQFEVKAFQITPYSPQETAKDSQSINLSDYVKATDLEPIKAEIKAMREKMENCTNGNGKESL